ncbi:hypothetical protein K7432_013372 [Basidiobolus ranarum]|uniref:Polo kinase n=1 Tax=Basidiobolus ranarum TaxID=34480 RepID=A0ABR2WJC2_9FUNG
MNHQARESILAPLGRCFDVLSIKNFEIGRLLGTGAFGHVYKAVGKPGPYEGRKVAIKMINKSKLTDDLRRRVVNEVEIQWQLQHPSILELFDYFEDENKVYLVMELCSGGELYRYLKERKCPLTESEARCVLRQLVDGLLYMHSNGIMHRDLKLSNILLTDEFHVKIADFGLATRIDGREGEQKTMCGTPNYISPEIISRQPYGFASDVWSLGCILFTFLTGKPPFESHKVRNTLDKVAKGDYILPHGLSPEAQDLIQKLLQIQPHARIQLDRILHHPFLSPSLPTQSLQRSKMPVVRHSPSTVYLEAKVPQEAPKTEEVYQRYVKDGEEKDYPKATSLQPINGERLKPIKQKTKHGTIEILSSGTIVLDLDGEKNIMAISKSGDQIHFFEKKSSHLPHEHLTVPVKSFTLKSLPEKYESRYRYVYRFVDLIRSKTPKIIFYSSQAKCLLMENGPLADFEMDFYNGIKVQNSASRGVLQIRNVQEEGSARDYNFDTNSNAKFVIPTGLKPIFRHIQECLKTCLDIEQTHQHTSDYPIIISHSETSSSLKKPQEAPSTDRFNTKAKLNNYDNHAKSDSGKGKLLQHDILPKKPMTVERSGSSSSQASSGGVPSSEHMQFIPNVGWCQRSNSGVFMLLFFDGIQMVVEAKNQLIIWSDHNTPYVEPQRFTIDKNLPKSVKTKLAYLPKFIGLFEARPC